jgi:hypothetical protein
MTSKSKKTMNRAEPIDPTLPFTEIAIAGKTYKMCFDYEALAQAETRLVKMGHDVNLNVCLPRLNFANTRVLFAASLLTYQPDTDFVAAKALVTRLNLFAVLNAMITAWNEEMPEPEADPLPPGE